MSDGIEEREVIRKRIEEEKNQNREDRIYIDDPDGGEPEREDS